MFSQVSVCLSTKESPLDRDHQGQRPHHTSNAGLCSRRYAFYWNAFLWPRANVFDANIGNFVLIAKKLDFRFQSTAEVTCVPETNLTLSINNTEIRVLDDKSGNATDTNSEEKVPPNTVRTNKKQSRSMTGTKHENSGARFFYSFKKQHEFSRNA